MALVMSSCHKEYFQMDKLSSEMEVRPQVVAPLIRGTMSMDDLVALFDSGDYVTEFEDGMIYLAFSDTFIDLQADELDLVPDFSFGENYLSQEIGTNPEFISSGIGDTVHFLNSTYFSLETGGESRFDSISFQGGEMQIEIASGFRHLGVVTISSEFIHDPEGKNYSKTIPITSSGGFFSSQVNHLLDGYSLETITQGDSSVIRLDYDLALINSGNPINPGESCMITIRLLDLEFYSLFGYIDPAEVVSDSGEQKISFYSDFPALSHLKLADPRINLRTESSLGIPFELTLDKVMATAEDMTTLSLEFYEGHPFKIPAPSLSQMGETVEGEFHINNQTSNFHELLNLAPSSLSYRFTGGPDPDILDQNHFLLSTSRFLLAAEFLLPLDLKYTKYALSDTLEFELGEEGVDTTIIKDVLLKVSTVNELPIELDLQLYLLDENRTLLDSVFEQEGVFLAGSEVDPGGLLLSASEQSNSASFPTEKLGILGQVRYIVVRASLVTSENGEQYVKFYSDYSLDFEISLHASLRINTQEL